MRGAKPKSSASRRSGSSSAMRRVCACTTTTASSTSSRTCARPSRASPSSNSMTSRRSSRAVRVADKVIGGGAPILVQSMTNTDTEDAKATAAQVADLARAGSEIVRITVNTLEAARQVPEIRRRLDAMNVKVPLVGDFHFNGHKLLTQVPECAVVLDKYRINPGNVGHGSKRDDQFSTMVEKAIEHGKPVRIGVNWGSLDPELL